MLTNQTTAPAARRALTPREVAEFLSVPPKQVYDVLKRLPVSAKFRIGKRIRVWEHGLLAWLESQAAG